MRTLARMIFPVAAAILGLAMPLASPAQVAGVTRISGAFGAADPSGNFAFGFFDCEMPGLSGGNCTGRYTVTSKDVACSNPLSITDSLVIAGLDLSNPGTIQGTITFVNGDYRNTVNGDGSCSINAASISNEVATFTGAWDGNEATIAIAPINNPSGTVIFGSFFKETAPAPVFPMVVTANIGAIATVSAVFQYRPQDVGTTGSVYTFAMAPANLVKSVPLAGDALPPLGHARRADGTKDAAVACVLAQLNSSGQLQAVSASSLQAYVSGVLSGQGQAVSIVNGVTTASIAGATFYVGYGANAAAMLSGGLNRSAITVPGARECKPQAPQTGWWWNPAEGGRGFSIEKYGNSLFYAGFLYDESGRSTWYVAAGPVSLDGSLFTGNLTRFTGGQTLPGNYKAPGPQQIVGPFTLAFSDAVNATMAWPGGTVALERFPIVPNGLAAPVQANVPESGWWWNESESGRGYFIEWQGGTAFLAGYMYDDAGNPVWYLSSYATPDPRQFTGNWWSYANGQTLTGAYKPATQTSNSVAPLSIRFDSTTTGTLTLPGNRTVPITRFRF